MEKLLYITAFPPNKRSGGQVYAINAIKDLSSKYVVDIVYFEYKDHELWQKLNGNIIAKFHPSYLNCIFHPFFYPTFTRRYNKRILDYINSIKCQYDVIYFDYSQVAIYSVFIEHPKKVIRCHDVIAQRFIRRKNMFVNMIKKNEKYILKSADYIFVPSKKDALLIKEIYDLDAIATNEYIQDIKVSNVQSEVKNLTFFGLWSRPENIEGLRWFISEVFPLLTEDQKATLVVMGGGLSKKEEDSLLTAHGIGYLGFVEDSYTVLARSKAVIVPLFHGAGIKVKVLDSFTTGTPVIGTDIAFEGIPEIDGLIYKANSALEFAEQISNIEPMSFEDKIRLKSEFYREYNCNHLTDYI